MALPKSNQLFKAVAKGNVSAIKKLLDAGVPIESQDHEHMTPLLRSAQNGQVEVFQFLLGAGADVNAVGMGPTDALEMAAGAGDLEVIRLLLKEGVSLEGHGNLNSPALKRMGHMTPLICAAIEGHVEAVRLLLEAVADRNARFDGETALQMVMSEIKFPLYANSEEETQRYREIAEVLSSMESAGTQSRDLVQLEIEHFARNAKKPAYMKQFKELEKRCGKAKPWKPVPDHGIAASNVVRFALKRCQDESILNALLKQAREAECHLVLEDPWIEGEDARFVFFPTNEKLSVVAVVGTEGANDNVHTDDIISWLKELNKENPFELRYCSHEMVGGDFVTAVMSAKKVAERMVEICPNTLGDVCETVAKLAGEIKKEKGFLLIWD